ncbi:MAG TPA: hypothetical protein VGG10_08355 [Rhizomicrobium sp.]|jgi:hypothetical protein
MKKRKQPDYGDQIARARKACETLGTDTPACSICGEDRPVVLERHHIAGRKYDPETMILCKNHHALMTDMQKNYPSDASLEPTQLERVGRMLLNLADLFRILVEKLTEFGHYLIELSQASSNGGIE